MQAEAPIPAEARTKPLLDAVTLEPVTTDRTRPEHQLLHGSALEVHSTVPTFTLAENRLDETGGNPGADPPGSYPVKLDYLRERYQDLISCTHGRTLYEVQSVVKRIIAR